MEASADSLGPQRPDLTRGEVRDNIQRYYDYRLTLALVDMQKNMELRNDDYGHSNVDGLGKKVLKNEEAAIYFDQQRTSPYLPQERQGLLRKTAVLYIYGYGVMPNDDRVQSLDDCIRKYNELELQAPSGEDEEPQLIGYEDIMNDLGEIRKKADRYLHQQRWSTRAIGKIGAVLSGHKPKR